MRSLISLLDISGEDVAGIVDNAVKYAEQRPPRSLDGRAVGIYFRRSSTRTRTSFWRAATLLGADAIAFGPDDLQLTTGETLADTARVLSGYLDVLVVRTNDDMAELRELDAAGGLGVVNALTRYEHPTQALADLATLQEEFGELAGRHVVYVGEGNSTAQALVFAAALTPGLRLTVVTPPDYGLPADVFTTAAAADRVRQCHSFDDVERPADAVYTSRWQTMGVAKANPDWPTAFLPYRVTAGLLDRVGTAHTVFLHDLPAVRGQEVTDEVLDGPRSRAWRQSLHKMTAAAAVLQWCAGQR
ncbi:MAG TPA: ornithine carbamoyltransferase [Actinophytocola sp.]|jgi:ornithine carbamoyltransferase|nr:ornithine carbamoyltransferase [Actinophytocola sp.]